MKRTDLLRAAGLAVLLIILIYLFLNKPGPQPQRETAAPVSGPSSSVSRTDANGVAWRIDQVGGGMVAIEPNGPKAGPPILVSADVQRVADREVSIGLVLQGQAGEQYRPVVMKNGTPVAAPKLRILNEAGQVVTQGDFQYG
jgi:hypothetical protein